MNVRIQTQGFAVTPPIGARVHERFGQALDRYADELIDVDVFLKDVNGPKGGNDKQVTVRLQIRRLAPLTISTTHHDLYRAIDVSAKRSRRAVRRAVKKKKLIRRRGLQYTLAPGLDY